MADNVVSISTAADPPRQMGREDRRIIYGKLNEVYISQDVGYDKGWTDHKVAENLGCPKAWVSQVREEMFGPEGSSEELREVMVEVDKALRVAEELRERQAQLRADIAEALEKAKLASDRLAELNKVVGMWSVSLPTLQKRQEEMRRSLGIR